MMVTAKMFPLTVRLAKRIAMWDGADWHALGTGADSRVNALVVDSATGTLFAGGRFFDMGGAGARNVAEWNGTTWSALGDGTDSEVLSLALDATGDLFVGGIFTWAGSHTGRWSSRLAKWNGSAWTDVSTGGWAPFGVASSLAIVDNQPVAGGGGVFMLEDAAVLHGQQTIVATSDTSSGDVWLASLNPNRGLDPLTLGVELRRYTNAWGAPDLLATISANTDIGILFDAGSGNGMVLWADGDNLQKKDFSAGATAATSDPVTTNTHGRFNAGQIGNGVDFALLSIDDARQLTHGHVVADPP